MDVTAKVGDAKRTAPITPAVYLAFEREHGQPYFEAIGTGKVEFSLWVAWKALGKAGQPVKPFEEWVDELDDLPEFGAEPKDGAGPLPPAA